MARIARVVAPNIPHHIVQRGNHRQRTFFNDNDYLTYIDLLAEWTTRFRVDVWAYCLMQNHVHLIAVPKFEAGLRFAIGEAHRRYTTSILEKDGEDIYGKSAFSSYSMDDTYLLAAARYVEMNPVKANIVQRPNGYRWSSTVAHLKGKTILLFCVFLEQARPFFFCICDVAL